MSYLPYEWVACSHYIKSYVPIWIGTYDPSICKVPVYCRQFIYGHAVKLNIIVNRFGQPRKLSVPVYVNTKINPFSLMDYLHTKSNKYIKNKHSIQYPIIVRIWNYIVQDINVVVHFIKTDMKINIAAEFVSEHLQETNLGITFNNYKDVYNITSTLSVEEQINPLVWVVASELHKGFADNCIHSKLINTLGTDKINIIRFKLFTYRHKPIINLTCKVFRLNKNVNLHTNVNKQNLSTIPKAIIYVRHVKYDHIYKLTFSTRLINLIASAYVKVNVVNLNYTDYVRICTSLTSKLLDYPIHIKFSVLDHIKQIFYTQFKTINPNIKEVMAYIKSTVLKSGVYRVSKLLLKVTQYIKNKLYMTIGIYKFNKSTNIHIKLNKVIKRIYNILPSIIRIDRQINVQATINKINRDIFIHLQSLPISIKCNIFFSIHDYYNNTINIFIDLLTISGILKYFFDLMPNPLHLRKHLLVYLNKTTELKFLNFSHEELSRTCAISFNTFRLYRRALLQWFLSRTLYTNEGYSNEIIFDVEITSPVVPIPPDPEDPNWTGGYVEYPYLGKGYMNSPFKSMGYQSSDVASGYVSPEAENWVKNAKMFWDTEQDIFE